MKESFELLTSTKKNATKQQQARWLIEKTGKNIPAGRAGLERKKQHSDTEEAEQSGRAVD